MKIEFDIESLLLQAKNDNGEIIKKWTFTDFEEVLGYEITHSTYYVMATYIKNNWNEHSNNLIDRAIDYYFALEQDEIYKMKEKLFEDVKVLLSHYKLRTEYYNQILSEFIPSG